MTTHPNPVWKDSPEICDMVDLPFYATKEAAVAYHEKHAPGTQIEKVEFCRHCGGWHIWSRARGKQR